MKVQFITQAGTRDAKKFGLGSDVTKYTAKSVHEFPDELARQLIEAPDKDTPPLAREYTREMEEAQKITDAPVFGPGSGLAPGESFADPVRPEAPVKPATFQQHPHDKTKK